MQNYEREKNITGVSEHDTKSINTKERNINMAAAAVKTGGYEIGKFWREKSYAEWEKGFFAELKKIMVDEIGAIPLNVWKEIYANEETRQAWITAFTHFSVDFQDNYEYFETFGDALLDSALQYLIYTNASVWQALQASTGIEGKISTIKQTYTSKTWMRNAFQKKFGDLKFYIRCTNMYQYQGDMMEDCLESMVFAIQYSLDKITWKGQYKGPGFPAVNKFVEWLYKDDVAKFSTTQKVESQFLKELLESASFNYSDITSKLAELSKAIKDKITEETEGMFFKVYGPRILKGAEVDNYSNPFAKMETKDIQGKYGFMKIRKYENNKYTVIYFSQEDYRMEYPGAQIDKTIAENKMVEALTEYMEEKYPKEVKQKRERDVGGAANKTKNQKDFREYGFIYKDENGRDNFDKYNEIMANIEVKYPNIDLNTVQFFSKINIAGSNYILWGIENNRKKVILNAEVKKDATKEERNKAIAEAASSAFETEELM